MLLNLRAVGRNIREGMKWGLIMAGLLCLWVLILIPFNGGLIFRDRSGEGIHAANILLLYVISGAVTGALFGALRPLLRWRIVAALLGVLATIPFGFGFLITRIGFTSWARHETLTLVIMALAFGGPGGLIIREFVRSAEVDKSNH